MLIAGEIVPFDLKYHLDFVDYSCMCGCKGTVEGSSICSCPGCGAPMSFKERIGSMYKFSSEEVFLCIPQM